MEDSKNPVRKILVCDDDVEIVDMLHLILKHHGFHVIPVTNSAEVLAIIRMQQPDIVLLDLWMPALSGDIILQQLKEDPATRSLPVFIISASTDGGSIAQRYGADAFIAKPFELPDLLKKIRSFLN